MPDKYINKVVYGSNVLINLTEDTVEQDKVLSGYTFHAADGTIQAGTMPNIGAQDESITSKSQEIIISPGFHDGFGKVTISSSEQEKIIAENIRNGVEILGVIGTYTGS